MDKSVWMLKDKHICMIKEVGAELLSLCLDSLRVSAARRRRGVGDCRWTLPSLPILSFLPPRSPRHGAPVLVAMVTRGEPRRATEGMQTGR